jgi:hypothetical protein
LNDSFKLIEEKLVKFILLFCLLFPIHLYSLNVRLLIEESKAYFTQFQAYEADFTMLSKGKQGNKILKGTYTFKDGESTCRIDNLGLGKAKINRDESLDVSNIQVDFNGIYNLFYTLYTAILTNDLDFNVTSDTPGNTIIRGGDPAGTFELILGYNKNIKLFDSFQYINKSGQNIEAKTEYTNINGVPVFSLINAVLPNGKSVIYLNRTSFELKPVTNE